jgi:uncharacterized BrkB/YihY/UPF0761 family membrane protein
MIIEEKVLKKQNADPMIAIGFEGVFGFIMNSFIALPIVQAIPGQNCGRFEHVTDGLVMLRQSPLILSLMFTYMISTAFYNILSLTVCPPSVLFSFTLSISCSLSRR